MSRYFMRILVAIAVFSVAWSVYAADTITFLHVNDLHGHMLPYLERTVNGSQQSGGAAYLAEAIKKEREKNQGGVVLVSAGDMFQGTPISNFYGGRPVLDFMNMVGFDGMTMGNHELDWGRQVLDGLVRDATFPVLCANIRDAKGEYLSGIKPYVMIERKGYHIAVIGFTTPAVLHMVNGNYLKGTLVLQPEDVVATLVKKVKAKGADVVVLLTHLGFDEDKQLASVVKGVDVIIGGHSHTVVTEAVTVKKTLIAQAGYNGIYLGAVTLVLDRKGGKVRVTEKEGRLKSVSAGPDAPYDSAVAKMAAGYNDKIKAKFQEVVGEAAVDLTRHGEVETRLGNVIADAMREETGADVALQNPGGIRADIVRGKITMEQVYTVLPFNDTLVTMDLSGSDLLALFETGSGVGRGMLQVSGVRLVYDLTKPLGHRIVRAEVGGLPLDVAKVYRVTTNDFLAAGGDKFSAFRGGKNVHQGDELREAFLRYLKRHFPVRPSSESRIMIQGQ